MKHHLLSCALALTLSLPAHAALLLFNFNDLAGGNTAATQNQTAGIPILTLQGVDVVPAGQPGAAYTDASGTTHPAGTAASWGSGVNDPGGNSMILHFDATGYQDFSLRYDYRSTSAGCPAADFQYRIGDSGDYVSVGIHNYTPRDAAFHAASVNLSALASLNGASNVDFRWVLAAGSGSGTFQVDNLELTGTAVPEPRACGLMVGLGLLAFAGYRRRSAGMRLRRSGPWR